MTMLMDILFNVAAALVYLVFVWYVTLQVAWWLLSAVAAIGDRLEDRRSASPTSTHKIGMTEKVVLQTTRE